MMICHDLPARLNDSALQFADGARERIRLSVELAKAPLHVCLQGASALELTGRFGGCPELLKRIPEYLSRLPVHLDKGERDSVQLHAAEGIFDLLRETAAASINASHICIQTPSLADGISITAVADTRSPGTWAHLAASDCPVLIGGPKLDLPQSMFLMTHGKEQGQPLLILGSENEADLLREMNGQVLVQSSERALWREIERRCDRIRMHRQRDAASMTVSESHLLRHLYEVEASFLQNADEVFLQGVSEWVDEFSSEMASCHTRLEESLERVDRQLTLDLEQHLQSGGPLVTDLESLLDTTRVASFNGWKRLVEETNALVPVVGGLFVGRTIRELEQRGTLTITESFTESPITWPVRLGRNFASLSRELPQIKSVNTWNTVISGGIKGLLSERLSPIGTRFIPGGRLLDRGLALFTAGGNIRKVVRDELRSQLTLNVMPGLSSCVQPVIRDVSLELRTRVTAEVRNLSCGRERDTELCLERLSLLLELDQADREELATDGIQCLENAGRQLEDMEALADQFEQELLISCSETTTKTGLSQQESDHAGQFLVPVLKEKLNGSADAQELWQSILKRATRQPVSVGDSTLVAIEVEYSRRSFDQSWDSSVQAFFMTGDQLEKVESPSHIADWQELPETVRDDYSDTGKSEQRFTVFPV